MADACTLTHAKLWAYVRYIPIVSASTPCYHSKMNRKRRWTLDQLKDAVASSRSMGQVIIKLGLIPAGGNYDQLRKYIKENSFNTSHFTGRGWSKGMKFPFKPLTPLSKILIVGSRYQSYKLKARLFSDKLKQMECELCGWKQLSPDGRLPLELDHVNGDRYDNRLQNLRVLCPNCHSMQPTHRGRNMKRRSRDGGIGLRASLKMM